MAVKNTKKRKKEIKKMKNNVFMNKRLHNRILAQDKYINNNTWETGLNNNDLIIGVSGAGKTRSYVIPNIMESDNSIIVVDTKNQLYKKLEPELKSRGFLIWNLNLANMRDSAIGYNPLNYIGKEQVMVDGKKVTRYNSQDIEMLAQNICPLECMKDPFWDYAAAMQASTLIAYILEALPENEHHLGKVARLQELLGTDTLDVLMEEWELLHPESFAVKKWHLFKDTKAADKTNASAAFILGEKLSPFSNPECEQLFIHKFQVDFKYMGTRPTALFINVSDSNRANDRLLNLLYAQALHELCEFADSQDDGRLPVPVRFIMDDFASNAVIPDFDKIISVIRSREIYVSLILQSLTQLDSMYGEQRAKTIINNCDTCLYLGGQDVNTAKYISIKANKTVDNILNMPVGDAWLFVRGQKPQQVTKFRLEQYDLFNPETKNKKVLTQENIDELFGGDLEEDFPILETV